MGDENHIRTIGDYSRPSHEGYRNTIELPEGKNMGKNVPARTIDQSAGGKLRDLNPEESWEILEDLALYDNESWNDPRDFAKPVKAIALPQDVPSTSDRRLIELENQVQCLMEAHLAPTQPTQMNKITIPCEICSGPHDTQCCMENPEQAFVEYASSRTDEVGEGLVSEFMASQDARLSKFEADFRQQQSEIDRIFETDIREKDEKSTKTNKTEHGMEKREKTKVKIEAKDQKVKVKVNPVKVNGQRRSRNEEMLNGPTQGLWFQLILDVKGIMDGFKLGFSASWEAIEFVNKLLKA
ncbi:hypothetical protein Tco_0785685 [Tanacetum coccineum]